ncbi:thermonuclease family protein [Lysinibacillus sphaericus]|uniref:thermonuclease family protein n=1 Tax=Lysinibacillus sphaericus TaxID=1421 RepID=UPI000C184FAF|nr:thermonuclease family protein [Lysinibacillus sphaericus]PIJ98105.1 thermonuclease [Lysinibacillus sphaericus]
MNWKRILTISLLTLSLAACEDDQTSTKKEPSIIYEVNEQMMAKSDSGVGEKVPELESNQEKVKFLWASDGDTAVFERIDNSKGSIGEQIKVRFLLIDSAEMKDKETGKPQPFAEAAKARTTELLQSAKEIIIETDEGDHYDNYQRLLAYVFVDGVSVQEILLEEGLAKVKYVFPPNIRYLDQFTEAEKIAINEGVGLWE